MTDSEIIKSLEDCFDKNEVVVSIYEPNDTKTDVTIQDVLDLINRQKAEIERLKPLEESLDKLLYRLMRWILGRVF